MTPKTVITCWLFTQLPWKPQEFFRAVEFVTLQTSPTNVTEYERISRSTSGDSARPPQIGTESLHAVGDMAPATVRWDKTSSKCLLQIKSVNDAFLIHGSIARSHNPPLTHPPNFTPLRILFIFSNAFYWMRSGFTSHHKITAAKHVNDFVDAAPYFEKSCLLVGSILPLRAQKRILCVMYGSCGIFNKRTFSASWWYLERLPSFSMQTNVRFPSMVSRSQTILSSNLFSFVRVYSGRKSEPDNITPLTRHRNINFRKKSHMTRNCGLLELRGMDSKPKIWVVSHGYVLFCVNNCGAAFIARLS